jgi:protein-tyrosine phosphatase
MVVHCTAGKDRTGVAAAVLLSALGVPRVTVVADYALTTTLLPPPKQTAVPKNLPPSLAKLYALPPDARAAVWRADPAYIEAALDAIDHEYGSVHGYLKQGLGLTEPQIQTLKANLTE